MIKNQKYIFYINTNNLLVKLNFKNHDSFLYLHDSVYFCLNPQMYFDFLPYSAH